MGTMSARPADDADAVDTAVDSVGAAVRALRAQLRAERMANDWTIDEFATRSGVSTRSMSRYLDKDSDTDIPTSAVVKIAAALGVSVEVLWRRAEARAEGR